jgi:hypothetical protein
MKSILVSTMAGAGLLLFSLSATAQDRDRDNDSYHSDRDAYFHDEHWRGHLFERVKEDVQHVQAVTWPGGGDQYRLGRTVDELSELQTKMANRVYDERDLDDVIAVLGRVVSDNRMSSRDRDILSDDLSRMREYREHHADWDR